MIPKLCRVRKVIRKNSKKGSLFSLGDLLGKKTDPASTYPATEEAEISHHMLFSTDTNISPVATLVPVIVTTWIMELLHNPCYYYMATGSKQVMLAYYIISMAIKSVGFRSQLASSQL